MKHTEKLIQNCVSVEAKVNDLGLRTSGIAIDGVRVTHHPDKITIEGVTQLQAAHIGAWAMCQHLISSWDYYNAGEKLELTISSVPDSLGISARINAIVQGVLSGDLEVCDH